MDEEENHNLLKAKMEEKVKKALDSNEIIEEENAIKIKKNNNKKIEKVKLQFFRKEQTKITIEKSKEKDNNRWNEQKSNLDFIEKNNELKKEQISEKHKNIEERIKDFQQRRINKFISKRKKKLIKIKENSTEISERCEIRNDNLMNKYHNHLKNISMKSISVRNKKENIKYFSLNFLIFNI